MLRHVDPQEVIARREFRIDGREVVLLVGGARPFGDGETDVFCPFRLEEADGTEIWSSTAGGVDSVQAVLLALTAAGERLATQGESLTFLDGSDLGLPRVTTAGAGWTATFGHGSDQPNHRSTSLRG